SSVDTSVAELNFGVSACARLPEGQLYFPCRSSGTQRMWIVALALRRPYTFIVMALLILILTPVTVLRMPTDIFPEIDIPVVSVIWFYTGMAPQEVADRIVANSERSISV